MRSRVAIIADAGPTSGLGHLSRAGAVAAALNTASVDTVCYLHGARDPLMRDGIRWDVLNDVSDLPEADAALVDSYLLPAVSVEELGRRLPLAVFHDEGPIPDTARVVISLAGPELGDRLWLCGLEYACLRPAYWHVVPRPVKREVRRCLVATGASDSGRTLAEASRAALPKASVTFVRGPWDEVDPPSGVETVDAPESLAPELHRADIAVCGGGQTMLEAAASGVPTVAVALASNQQRQVEVTLAAGAVVGLDRPDPARVRTAITTLGPIGRRRELSERARYAVDGRGAERVAERISSSLVI